MKKFLGFLLAICMVVMLVATPMSVLADDVNINMGDYDVGDINDDGEVNLYDLVTIAQAQANWVNIRFIRAACNTNGDDVFDIEDVTHLAKHLAGWGNVLY